jgi:hypothetical protein
MEFKFFDVPVYRLPRKEYDAKREAWIQKEMDEQPAHVREWYAQDAKEAGRVRSHLRQHYGGTWDFNEIIGFIRLHFLGTQIRGEWWRVTADRVTRSRTKRFEFRDWKVTYEEEISAGSCNTELYALILKYLARAQKEGHIKRFYVDTSIFERIGPYVDWNALLKKASERPGQSARTYPIPSA